MIEQGGMCLSEEKETLMDVTLLRKTRQERLDGRLASNTMGERKRIKQEKVRWQAERERAGRNGAYTHGGEIEASAQMVWPGEPEEMGMGRWREVGVVEQVLTKAVVKAFSGGVQLQENLRTYSPRDPTMIERGGMCLSEEKETLMDVTLLRKTRQERLDGRLASRGGKLDACTQAEGKSGAERNPHTLGIRGDHTDGSATRTDGEGYGELEDGWHIVVSHAIGRSATSRRSVRDGDDDLGQSWGWRFRVLPDEMQSRQVQMNGFCAEHTRYRIYLHRDTGICKRAVWSEFKSRWGALGSQEDGLRTGMWLSNDGKTIGVINRWTGKGKRRKTPDTELYRRTRKEGAHPKDRSVQATGYVSGYPLTRGAGNEGKLDCGAEERMGVGWEGESRDCWMTRSANEQEEVYSQTRLTPVVESEVQHPGALSGSPRRKADRARRTARVASTGGETVGISSSVSGPPSQRGGWVGNGRESVDRSKVSGGRTITDPGGTIHQLKAWEPGKHNEWARGMKTRHVGDQMEEASCKSEGGRSVSEPGGMQTGEGGRVVVDDGGAMRAGREKSASADQPEAKDLGDTINRKTVEGKEDYRSGKDGSTNPEGSVDLSKARQEEGGTE
ncbi:hypothetical protein BJ322DRAFT_1025499 [Thelephora terrestris]|uniref:Uncharacterized protein n=1 Tax=Thelephora terrestris TaxID=56493 RepID=A0A9P6L0W9_9AGAM|nr:hypothetical protein BJ322DRAFT_1025564 [Thelephora terrestris]KAF9777932.1 hypothetical protein BJ322DRAFT_1025499 [Thelephora terrestris]